MDRAIIQWNIVNWITVVLMVSIGFVLSGAVVAFVKTNLPQVAATGE